MMRTLLLLGIVAYYATSVNGGVVNAASDFNSNFFKAVVEDEYRNIICSPMSAELVLLAAERGAGGNTLNQLQSVLKNTSAQVSTTDFLTSVDSYTEIELQIASNVFVAKDRSLKCDFKSTIERLYKASAENIDFGNAVQASKTINDWSASHTNNRIKEVVTPEGIQKDLALVLVNAIYFKAGWANPFYPNETESRPFHVNGKTIKQVPTMHRVGVHPSGRIPNMNASFVELRYKSQDLPHDVSMYIILPDEIDGFVELKEKLGEITLNMLRRNEWSTEVDIFLPKFKIESSLELNGPLMKMGLTDMFSDAANFRGIVAGGDVKVSKIIQKSFLEVNEEGSEAAAVTEVDLEDRIIGSSEPTKFIVDRPFFSIIATESGVTLFSALTVDPHNE